MWLIKFLPDWIFYGLFFAGVLGLIATYFLRLIPIPFLYMYKTPIQLASIFAVGVGTFMSGAIFNEHSWLERVREMEAKVAAAEVKSSQENVKIIERVINNTQIIRERGNETVKYIDKEIIKYDNTCVIPEEFVKVLNKTAEQPK